MPHIFPIFESVLLPPGLFVVLIVFSLLLLGLGRRRAGFVVGGLSALLLYLVSISPLSDLLIAPLENRYTPFVPSEGKGAEYVVVLGGGIVPVSPAEGGKGSLAPESLKRLVYGIRIARETKLPIIVSGGIVPSIAAKESEAEVARRTVEELTGPSQTVLIEGKSRNTWGNAVGVEAKFHPKRVILVTSAYHMPRSVLAFRRNHIDVVPAPTDYLSDRGGLTPYSFLPSSTSLRDSAIALKEYLGYLYYRVLLYHHA
jgi:uncharacterized SAM-binding protein YcdF (DUF218 family)